MRKRGFTLVELLIVIAIIGVLAAIVLISLGGARSRARDAKRQSDVQQVLTAQEMYYNEHESYMATGTTEGIPAIGTFLGSLDDPQTGRHYTWLDNTSCDQSFCAYSILESGQYFAVSEKGSKLLDATPTDGCDCWAVSEGEDGEGAQTCSEKGGACCSSGYTCSSGKISGASDCIECCGSLDNCSGGGGPGGEDKKENGEVCASGSECISGFCVDGQCCNGACDTAGICQTGGGCSAGSCVAVSDVPDNTQTTGCDSACQACQSGVCGYADAGTDPGSLCGTAGCLVGSCSGSSYVCGTSVVAVDASATINGDIVYCDEHNRLWTTTQSGTYAWDGAVDKCSGLAYAGITEWVLPSCASHAKDSGCALYQFGLDACSSYPCSPTVWDASARASYYWSSAEYVSPYAWSVYFNTGYVNINDKSYSHYVRCVLE